MQNCEAVRALFYHLTLQIGIHPQKLCSKPSCPPAMVDITLCSPVFEESPQSKCHQLEDCLQHKDSGEQVVAVLEGGLQRLPAEKQGKELRQHQIHNLWGDSPKCQEFIGSWKSCPMLPTYLNLWRLPTKGNHQLASLPHLVLRIGYCSFFLYCSA